MTTANIKETLVASKDITIQELVNTFGELKNLKFTFDNKAFEIYNTTSILHCCELKKDLTRKSCTAKNLTNFKSEWFWFGVQTGSIIII